MVFKSGQFSIMLSLLSVAIPAFGNSISDEVWPVPKRIGQVKHIKNFRVTPETVVKTNLPKQASCLFALQRLWRERFGQSAIMGGRSVVELWTDAEIKGNGCYVLDITANKLSIRGSTQESILYGLKTLDRILLDDVSLTANKQIAPVHIDETPLQAEKQMFRVRKKTGETPAIKNRTGIRPVLLTKRSND